MVFRMESHLAKVHRLDTLTTQRRTDRGTGARLAGSHDQLHDLVYWATILGHFDGDKWIDEA